MTSVVRKIIEIFKPDIFKSSLAYKLGGVYLFRTSKEDLTKLIEASESDNITIGFELNNGDYNLYAVDLDKVNVAVKMIRSMVKHKDRSVSDIGSMTRIIRDIDNVNYKINKEKWL